MEFYRKKFAGSQADRIVRAEAEAGKLAEELKKTKVSGYISFCGRRIMIIGYRKEMRKYKIKYEVLSSQKFKNREK